MTSPVVPPGAGGTSAGAARVGAGAFTSVGIASIVSAAAGYVVLLLTARGLSKEVNADFLVFWSLLFGGFGVLGGIQQETTRAVGSTELEPTSARRHGRILLPALAVAGGLAVVVAVASPLWRPVLLAGQAAWIVPVLCASWLCYAGHLQVIGALSGRRQWGTSAVVIGGESALRMVLVGIALGLGAGLMGVEAAAAASVVFWLGMLVFSARTRAAARARADAGVKVLVRRLLQTMLASAGSAVLVVGFPSLLRATTTDAGWKAAAPLVVAISMTRAPLMVPLTAFQGVVISHFLNPPGRRSSALLRILAVVAAVSAVGAAAAYLVGPWFMATFFGAGYRVPGGVLAALTAASGALAALTVAGACVLAVGRHAAFAAGWILAAVVSALLLLTPLPIDQRAVVSLAAGPLLGLAAQVVALIPVLRERALPGVERTAR